jgi:glycosyltransferase involved in cell wall biosynthesis
MADSNVVKKKVVLRAPILSQSGYGVHSRQIARWLLSRPDVDLIVQPVQWGITPWYLNATAQDGFIGKLLERAREVKDFFDVSFQVQLPNEWTVGLARKDVGVTAGVETTTCNPEWIKNINAMSHVVVPSSHVKATFERTSQLLRPNDVHVIPESFIDAVNSNAIPLGVEFDTKFNFLLIGQLTSRTAESDRKNIFNTLKWFCEVFAGDSNVGLIVKTNSGRETKIDRKVTTDAVVQVLNQVRKGPFPKIHLIHGALTDNEIAGLYTHPTVKAFISLTRGEGFGLPILEAAASGVPIITTNWSGHLDFLKYGKYIKLDFELRQIPKSRIDKSIFVTDAKWADVNEQDVKRKLIKFKERPEIPTQWAHELKTKIRELYSHVAVSQLYDKLWEQLS